MARTKKKSEIGRLEMTSPVAISVFLGSVGVLYYIYHGYLVVLRLLVLLRKPKFEPVGGGEVLSVTVVLTVHNEERRIRARLDNLLALDYPNGRMEILVVSDGSTDQTCAIVAEYQTRAPVRLFEFQRVGKSQAQNLAIRELNSDIVALTDADCIFASDYMRELIKPFGDPKVGCVTANLRFRSAEGAVARGQGYYWTYELKLRDAESRLGILAVASGSAMALRRSAWIPLDSDVGEDCMIPLDTVLQGLKVLHQPAANALDTLQSTLRGELRARVRMTLRNWLGTWRRPAILWPWLYPGYAFALWSHKLLRWLSPLFIIAATLASVSLAFDPILWPIAAPAFLFFAVAALGAARVEIPGAESAWIFCVANVGFLIALVKALFGHTITGYINLEESAHKHKSK